VPRLVGKQSNEGLYAWVVIIAAVLVAGSCEYFGVINVVPKFGSETNTLSRFLSPAPSAEPGADTQR
jgi:hypothetical protein